MQQKLHTNTKYPSDHTRSSSRSRGKEPGHTDRHEQLSCRGPRQRNQTDFLPQTEKSHYDTTRQLVFYKDRIYVMGYTIAGASVLIYDLAGNFIKEIRLPDAIAVNSMTAIPQLNELWITSYGKFIKKGMSPTILSVLTWPILHPATSCCFRTISTRSTLSISRRRSFSPCSTLIFTEIS